MWVQEKVEDRWSKQIPHVTGGTLMPTEGEWQSQGQTLGFQDPRLSSPHGPQSFHGWPLPPATWKPFVWNRPPSSPKD